MDNTRHNASKSLSRTGTAPRTIHYSQSKQESRFEYQNKQSLQMRNPSIELKGTLNIKTKENPNQNKEIDPFKMAEMSSEQRRNVLKGLLHLH